MKFAEAALTDTPYRKKISSMGWVTILCFSAALAWTAISFMAYRDLELIFLNSLIGWLLCGLLWIAGRVNFARLVGIRGVFGKMKALKKTVSRNRLALAGILIAIALAVFVLNISTSTRQWLGIRNGREHSSGREPPPMKQKLPTAAKNQPKVDAVTTQSPQRTKGPWSVQVAAVRNERDAINLATALKDRGYEAYVIRVQVNTVDLYQIRVGRFRTREEAEKFLPVLRDKEAYTTAFVAGM